MDGEMMTQGQGRRPHDTAKYATSPDLLRFAFPKDNPGPGPPLDITAPSFRAVHDRVYMLPHESQWGDDFGPASKFDSKDGLEAIIMGWGILVAQGTFSFSQFCMLFVVFLFRYLIHFNQSVYLTPCPLIEIRLSTISNTYSPIVIVIVIASATPR
jgi:hypothetical protein